MKTKLLLAFLLLCCLGLLAATSDVYLKLTGGTMTGPIVGKIGGHRMLLTTAGGAHASVSDLGTGDAQLTDNSGNGVIVADGIIYVRNGGSQIGVGSETRVSGPFAISDSLTPSSGSTACVQGQIAWDQNFLYLCTSAGPAGSAIWKSVPLVIVH
jgi:hypothetical protein